MRLQGSTRARALLVALALVAPVLLALPGSTAAEGEADPATTVPGVNPAWWNPAWHFRIPVTVTAALPPAGKDRPDEVQVALVNWPVDVEIDFRAPLVAAGFARGSSLRGFVLDPASIRVVGPDRTGAVGELPSTFAPVWFERRNEAFDPAFNPHGTVSFVVEGPVSPGKSVTFWIYFDSIENGAKPIPNYREYDAFGAPKASTLAMGRLDARYWTGPGTVLYGYTAPGTAGTQSVEVVGLHPDTSVKVYEYLDGVPNPVPRDTFKLNAGETKRSLLAAGPLRVEATKPVLAATSVGEFEGKLFYPAATGGLLGSEFILSPMSETTEVLAPLKQVSVALYLVNAGGTDTFLSQGVAKSREPLVLDTPPGSVYRLLVTDAQGNPSQALARTAVGIGGYVAPSTVGSGIGNGFLFSEAGSFHIGSLEPGTLDLFSQGRRIDTRTLAGANATPLRLDLQQGQGVLQASDILMVSTDTAFWVQRGVTSTHLGAVGGLGGTRFDLRVPEGGRAILIPFFGETDVTASPAGGGENTTFLALNAGATRELPAGRYNVTATKPVSIILAGAQGSRAHGMILNGYLPSPKHEVGALQWGGRLVTLSAERSLEFVEAGTTVKVPVTLTNRGRTVTGGNLPDSVTLTLTEEKPLPPGWKVNLVPLEARDLRTGQSVTLDLIVEVAKDASAGNVTELSITAKSAGNPRMSDVLTIGFEPKSKYEVTLLFDDGTTTQYQPLNTTGGALFRLVVSNVGNAIDDVALSTSRPFEGWSANLSASRLTLAPGASEVVTLATQAPAGNTGFLPLYVTAKSSGSPVQKQILAVSVVAADSDVVILGDRNETHASPGGEAVYNLTLENRGGATTVLVSPAGFLPPGWGARLERQLPDGTWTQETTIDLAAKDDPQGNDRVALRLMVSPAPGSDAFVKVPLEIVAKPPVKGSRGEARFTATTIVAAVHDLGATLGADGSTLTLVNRGNGPEGFRFAVGRIPDNWTIELPDPVLGLQRDGTVTRTLRLTPGPDALAGTYDVRLLAVFDDGARLDLPLSLTLSPSERLTLRLSAPTVATYSGGLAEVRGVLENAGTVSAAARLRLEGGGALIPTFTPEELSLAPGASAPFTLLVRVPLASPAGVSALTVRAESAGTGEQLASADLSLSVATVDLRFEGDPFATAQLDGETRRLEARVVNSGSVPVQNVTVTAFEEVNGVWVAVGNVTFETVAPASGIVDARPRVAAFEWTSAPGATRVKVEIDPYRSLPDGDRDNGVSLKALDEAAVPALPLLALLATLGLVAAATRLGGGRR